MRPGGGAEKQQVLGVGLEHGFLDVGGHAALLAHEESGAAVDALGAQRKRSVKGAVVGNATCGHNGRVIHGINDERHDGEGAQRHVGQGATLVEADGHDDVGASGLSLARVPATGWASGR